MHSSPFTSILSHNSSAFLHPDFLLLNSGKVPCFAWALPLRTTDFAVYMGCLYKWKTRVIIGFPHLYPSSQQSEVICCLWYNVWKKLLHVFCEVFYLFTLGVKVQYQLLHNLRQKTVSQRPRSLAHTYQYIHMYMRARTSAQYIVIYILCWFCPDRLLLL